jgi:MATE family multidrug resistance protein
MLQTTRTSLPIVAELLGLWKNSWPVLVGQLAMVGMGAADVIMSGHFSSDALASVSVGVSLWAIALVTVLGIMMAVNTLVAHEVGASNHQLIPHLVRQALWKSLFVGILSCALLNWSTGLLPHLGLEARVETSAVLYVRLISIGAIPFSMYRVLYGYSAAINQTLPMMLIALGGLAFNIFANWVFIYGKLGIPAMGGPGCAVGTDLGLFLTLVAMVVWVGLAPAYRSTFPFTHWATPLWSEIGAQLKIGIPIGITYFAEASSFSLIGLLVARFGVVPIAAHSIALNFASVVFMVPMSLGIGLITRIGHLLGGGDPAQARKVALMGVKLAILFGLVSATVIALFRHQIVAIYSEDPAVQARAAQLLLLAAVFQASDATQVVAASAIRGYKVTRPPMLIHLLAFWALAIPLGCILGLAPSWIPFAPSKPLEVEGFWIALTIALTFAAIGLVWYLERLSRRIRAAAQA